MNIEKMRTWLKLYGIKNILFRAINEKVHYCGYPIIICLDE